MSVEPVPADDEGTPIFKVWKAYEDVAMHFNDLLMRLRIQALGGVAALAILASIFSNVRTIYFQGTWLIASAAFFALMLIWLAIAALDLLYYNRLLVGSVAAITAVEEFSRTHTRIDKIDLSTRIEAAVKGEAPSPFPKLRGVRVFYAIVFCTLALGFGVSLYGACKYPRPDRSQDELERPLAPQEQPVTPHRPPVPLPKL